MRARRQGLVRDRSASRREDVMSTYPLLYLGRQLLGDRESFLSKFPNPWLVWAPPSSNGRTIITGTGVRGPEGERGEVEAMEVKKGGRSAFPFGITIGHSANNDIVLRHEQVSRFHAYIQERDGRRFLVDAESKNGTFIDGRRLSPSRPEPLPAQAQLRFGDWEVRYFEPESFKRYLDQE
jgi:hypothetical protein